MIVGFCFTCQVSLAEELPVGPKAARDRGRLIKVGRHWPALALPILMAICFVPPNRETIAQQVQLQLTDEQRVTLEEWAVSETGISGSTLQGAAVQYSFSELAHVQWNRESTKSADVECLLTLTDQSVLTGANLALTGAGMELAITGDGARILLDPRMVQSIRLGKLAQSGAALVEWNELNESAPAAADGLAIYRDERMQWLEGKIGEITSEHVQFTIEERTANVKRSRIEGLRFLRPAGQELLKAMATIELLGGSKLRIARVVPAGSRIAVTLVCGLELEFGMDQLIQIDFASSRSKWLSDFPPTTIDWKPLLGGTAGLDRLRKLNLPRIKVNQRGQPLQLEFSDNPNVEFSFSSREFEHGFAVQAGGKLAFQLDRQYSRLTGKVGFDPEAAPAGNVTLIVRGDQNELLRLNLTNARRTNPESLDLDMTNVGRLVIEVDYADGRSSGDLLNLCDWRVHQ